MLVNTQAEVLFDYTRDQLLGEPVDILVPYRFRTVHPELRASFTDNPEARPMGAGRDLYGLRRDGSEFPVEIGLSPIETQEGVFILSAIVDITGRKRLEDALRQANEELEQRVQERTLQLTRQTEELQRTNEALVRSNLDLQRFAYIASHDLQSPLRSIAGFIQLLQLEYEGQLDEQADEWISRTVQSLERLQTSIQDLLTYSRVDSEARPSKPLPFRAVLNDATMLLDASIQELGAQITCDELPTVMGDRSQFVQLMQNLIGNALAYRGDDPPNIHVSAERGSGEWVLSVRDNGIGIPPEQHDQIFEIFQRGHNQGEHQGSGIGLAVCRRVVHRHGGEIWLESAPGQGSTFYFTIPERMDSDS